MRLGPVLIVAIALVVTPAHAWTTWQGDAGRSGIVEMGPGPFDVLQRFELHDENLSTAALPGGSHAVTPEGVVAVANRGDQCVLLRWDEALSTVDETVLDRCRHGSLQGYAPEHDLLAICTVGSSEDHIFQLRDARTGQLRFRVVPDDLVDSGPDGQAETWSCQGAAVDARAARVIVPMAATSGQEALRFQLVEVSLESGETTLLYPINPVEDDAPGVGLVQRDSVEVAEFWPRAVTLTEGGFVVTGFQRVVDDVRPALLWTRPGSLLAGDVAGASVVVAPGEYRLGSSGATALGALAAARIGHDVVVVDPNGGVARREPLPFEGSASASIDTGLPPPVAFEHLLIVPMRSSLVALSADGLDEAWRWNGHGTDWLVGNVVASVSGELHALLYEDGDGQSWHAKAAAARFDARTGQLLQLLPLPLSEPRTPAAALGFTCMDTDDALEAHEISLQNPPFCPGSEGTFRLLPTADGMVIATSRGDAVRLGPARADATIIEHSHLYPRQSEQVSITVPLDGQASVREVVVVWGDGAVESQEPPEATPGLFRQVEETTRLEFVHAYGEDNEDMRVAVTTVFEDGTTATESFTYHVGKSPPPVLNFMQRQFAAENQDRTYGILGIAVAMLGGLYAAFFRKRRHRRLRRHLQMLDAIHERSLTDAEGAVKELDAHQRHIRSMLMAGRIDDGEFRVLADRAAGISKRLHRRLLGPLSPKLSPGYRRQIESAFEDGLLTTGEAQHLVEAIGQEKALDKTERALLQGLLADWTVEPTV